MLTALSVPKTKIMTWVLLMRADQSSSTIKRNNMELGKHVQLTLVSFEQQMLPTSPISFCTRFTCNKGNRRRKCHSLLVLFFIFVILFAFWYRFLLFSPYLSNREYAAAKENMILGYAPLKENEGQICLKPVKTMTCSRFEEVHLHLQCTALWPVRTSIIRIQRFVQLFWHTASVEV